MILLERAMEETSKAYTMRVLRENITRLELTPGSVISEADLAELLGMSRTPIREALMELSRARIVEIYPQKRGRVALIDPDYVDEMLDMRKILECAVVRDVCALVQPEDLMRLEANVKMQGFFQKNAAGSDAAALDEQFHKYLFQIAKREHVWEVLNFVSIHIRRVRFMVLQCGLQEVHILQDHQEIFQAIQDRDPDRAAEKMAQHLERKAIYREVLPQKFPAEFFSIKEAK